MPTTTDGFPYPAASDPLGDGHAAIQELAEFLDDVYTPWTAYTPTFTNITTGGSTFLRAEYRRWLDTVDFRIYLELGTGDDVTGAGLPVEIHYEVSGLPSDDIAESSVVGYPLGVARMTQGGPSGPSYLGILSANGGGDAAILLGDGALPADGFMQNDEPFDWSDGDTLILVGRYRTTA